MGEGARAGRLLSGAGVGLGAIVVASGFAALLAQTGCFGRQCDGDFQSYGGKPGEGRLLDPDTWETTSFDGKWLGFPHRRTWVFDTSALGPRAPESVIAYVSAQETPNELGGNFTVGGGNLVTYTVAKPGSLWVTNDTCADYYIRVVVKAPPGGNTPPPTDASQADASSDGGTE